MPSAASGFVWIEVWLQPESTKAWYVPPLILTGIWYCPAWSGAAVGEVGDPDQQSQPPSWDSGPGNAPDPLIASRPAQALPTARPAQKDRQGIAGERMVVLLGALPLLHAGATDPPWPLPLLGGARGAACTRDLGAGTGREREGREGGEREGERELLNRGSPTLGQRHIWSSASWMACVIDVGRWHWTHFGPAVRRG